MTGTSRNRIDLLAGRWGISIVLVCICLWSTLPASAQRAGDQLEVRGVEYTSVDGQSILIVSLHNPSEEPVQASGLLSVTDAGGLEVERMEVSSGVVQPGSQGVLAVPLDEPLQDGRYAVTLVLRTGHGGTAIHSGPHRVDVGTAASPDTGSPLVNDDAEASRVFPSWLLMLGGVTLIAIGLMFRHESGSRRRKRRIPDVATVRKVQLKSTRPKKPATIKPLVPPGRRKGE